MGTGKGKEQEKEAKSEEGLESLRRLRVGQGGGEEEGKEGSWSTIGSPPKKDPQRSINDNNNVKRRWKRSRGGGGGGGRGGGGGTVSRSNGVSSSIHQDEFSHI